LESSRFNLILHLQDEELTLIGQFALEAGMMCCSLACSGFAELASTATMAACLLSSTRIEGKILITNPSGVCIAIYSFLSKLYSF
jgi:hypothetical protein